MAESPVSSSIQPSAVRMIQNSAGPKYGNRVSPGLRLTCSMLPARCWIQLPPTAGMTAFRQIVSTAAANSLYSQHLTVPSMRPTASTACATGIRFAQACLTAAMPSVHSTVSLKILVERLQPGLQLPIQSAPQTLAISHPANTRLKSSHRPATRLSNPKTAT